MRSQRRNKSMTLASAISAARQILAMRFRMSAGSQGANRANIEEIHAFVAAERRSQRLSRVGRLAHGAYLISISGPLPWGEYLPLKKRVFETPITVSCTNKPLEIVLPKNQQNVGNDRFY